MKRAFHVFSTFIVLWSLAMGFILYYLAHNYLHQLAKKHVKRDLEMLVISSDVTNWNLLRAKILSF